MEPTRRFPYHWFIFRYEKKSTLQFIVPSNVSMKVTQAVIVVIYILWRAKRLWDQHYNMPFQSRFWRIHWIKYVIYIYYDNCEGSDKHNYNKKLLTTWLTSNNQCNEVCDSVFFCSSKIFASWHIIFKFTRGRQVTCYIETIPAEEVGGSDADVWHWSEMFTHSNKYLFRAFWLQACL